MREALRDPSRKDIVKEAVREVLSEQDPDERKAAVKDAYKEILHEILVTFGKWSLSAIGGVMVVTFLGILLYFGAIKAGWTPPK